MTNAFIPPYPLKTPVLFLTFNRPDTTKQVFEAIRQAKPPRLYIAADGPRDDKTGEQEKCKEVRRIATQVDWNCEVKTLFRNKNWGCKYAVSGAIDWFFENEEEGIILEDDCLPSQSFFWFCEELLERYKDDKKIMQVNGSCFLKNLNIKYSYFFSKYNHIWGWASWRRSWKHFNLNYRNWKKKFLNMKESGLFNSENEEKYWQGVFENYFSGLINSWDYPWTFSIWKNSGLSVYPTINMAVSYTHLTLPTN